MPQRALEPKVLVPFAPGAGRTPRRIVIERQKRLFALQDVGALLLDLGVDVNEPDTLTDGGMEPLESFDDTEYEGRPIEEWMALADDAGSGGPRGVPARFLHEGAWRECVVTSYDDESREFSLTFSEAPGAEVEEGTATRINICFAAEDPFVFARRVAAAHAARREALERMRFQLYVDAMPTDELLPLEKVQHTRNARRPARPPARPPARHDPSSHPSSPLPRRSA